MAGAGGRLVRLGVALVCAVAAVVVVAVPAEAAWPRVTTATEAFVDRAYRDFLGRPPDRLGLRDWTRRLDARTVTRRQLVETLTHSDEYLGTVVDQAYSQVLQRTADAGGRAYWIGRLRAGVRPEQIAVDLASSLEHYLASGARQYLMFQGGDWSHYQDGLKVPVPGAAYGWAKSSEGSTFVDSDYAGRQAAARAAGWPLGAYHFVRPAGDPVAQARFWRRVTGGVRAGDVRPLVDVEVAGITEPFLTAFLDEVRRQFGVEPVLYTYTSYLLDRPWMTTAYAGRVDLVIADYRGRMPSLPGWNVVGWQNANTGPGGGDSQLSADVGALLVQPAADRRDVRYRVCYEVGVGVRPCDPNAAAPYVDALYRELLGRPADPSGQQTQAARLYGGATRSSVATALSNSLEARRFRVTGLYRDLLGRDPDPGGLDHWAGVILTDGALALAGFLASSEEYWANAAASLPSHWKRDPVGVAGR